MSGFTKPSGLGVVDCPMPNDCGYQAWTFDPAAVQGAENTAKGSLDVAMIVLRTSATITNHICRISTAGTGLVNCYGVLYTQAATLIAATADQSVPWATGSTNYTAAFVGGPFTLGPGIYYAGIYVSNASTTAPQFGGASTGLLNQGNTYTAGTFLGGARSVYAGSGLTGAPPANIGVATPNQSPNIKCIILS